MNWADITIIGVIAVSVVVSVFRGFVREVLSLLAWVVAFWAAASFAGNGAALLEPHVEVPTARLVLAFIGILIVALLGAGVVNHLICKLIDKTGLSGTDRLLGAVFGAARGAAVVFVGVLACGLTSLPADPWWGEARTIPPFETAAVYALQWMPADVAKYFSF
ncbi:MAG: CvpA family protein [Gammaproteobacteria bacterium]